MVSSVLQYLLVFNNYVGPTESSECRLNPDKVYTKTNKIIVSAMLIQLWMEIRI